MRKAFGGFQLFLILCGLVMILICAVQALGVPDVIEYVTPADHETAEAPSGGDGDGDKPQAPARSALKTALMSLEESLPDLEKVSPRSAAWGYAPSVAATDRKQADSSATAALIAVGQGYFQVYERLPAAGRLFYDDELKYGDMVAILDEQLALKIFKVPDPIGRELTVAEKTYRVVGVLRHERAVGDAADFAMYVPIAAIANQGGAQLQALALSAVPKSGAGTLQAVKTIASGWRPGGTIHDARKAKQMALLVPRWASGALMLYGLILLFHALAALGGRWVAWLRGRLKDEYAWRLLPRAAWRALAWLMLLGALAFVSYLLFRYMTDPILIFPEWVPQVPVEPEEIQKTFWYIRYEQDRVLQMGTPISMRLRFFKDLGVNGALVLLVGLVLGLLHKLRAGKS